MKTNWLNYHHLHYFWLTAREGSMTKACEQLHLSQPTLSSQIRKLEKSLGSKLFERTGRSLTLTEMGHVVYRYADEIFALGRELGDVVHGAGDSPATRLVVGVPDVIPKLIVYRLLRPAIEMGEHVQLVTYEGKLDQLVADLGMHRLDVVLSDSPLSPTANVKAFTHLLGECGVTFFGTHELVEQYQAGFPQSLSGAPMLLPTQTTHLRRALEQWFDELSLHPQRKHEFEDSALLKVFGQSGEGIFAAPSAIEREICTQYNVQVLGTTEMIKERFYALSIERRLKHPAVIRISQSARQRLFAKTRA
jgi:LysR family transcriptional activator of nhaA